MFKAVGYLDDLKEDEQQGDERGRHWYLLYSAALTNKQLYVFR